MVKHSTAYAIDLRDVGSIPGSGRSLGREDPSVGKIPGGGHDIYLEGVRLELGRGYIHVGRNSFSRC